MRPTTKLYLDEKRRLRNSIDEVIHLPAPVSTGRVKTRRVEQGNLLSINDLGHGGSDHPLNSMRTCFFSFTLFFRAPHQPT